MIRRPPRSTLSSSSAASDVYKRQLGNGVSRVQPHRKVTMLFDVECRSAKALGPLQTMLLQLSRDGASALELPPHPVDVNRRMQECASAAHRTASTCAPSP